MQSSLPRPFLPDQPPAAMRALQRKRFFGTGMDWRAVILTPIGDIYNVFPDGKPLTEGWWQSKTWQDVLISATPQSSAILDPVCALEPATPILFLGLAGALTIYTVGDVVEPSTVLLDELEYAAERSPSSPYPDVRAVTVRCLNESIQRQEELGKQADVVEMESGWVCAAAHEQGRKARIVLIVSDELHGHTFLENELDDLSGSISRTAAEITEQIMKGF